MVDDSSQTVFPEYGVADAHMKRKPALLQPAQELRQLKPDNDFIMEERGRQEVLPLVKELWDMDSFRRGRRIFL